MTDKQCRKRVQNFQNFRRADLVVRHQQLEMLECLVKKVNEEKKIASRVKFSYRRCFLESLVLGKSKYYEAQARKGKGWQKVKGLKA